MSNLWALKHNLNMTIDLVQIAVDKAERFEELDDKSEVEAIIDEALATLGRAVYLASKVEDEE